MTFRARLTLAYLVLLTLALSGFGIWVYAYVDRNLHQEFSGSVQRQSAQLAQVLASDYDIAADQASDTLDRWTNDQQRDTYIVVETRVDRELRLEIEAKHPEDALSGVDLPSVPPDQVVNVRPAANDLGLPLAVYATRFEASKAVPRARPTAPDQPKDIVELEGQVTVARSLAGVERSLRLLRTILTSAVEDELIRVNPCHIRGAGSSKRVHRIKPASLEELTTLVEAMPDRLKVMS